MKSAGKARNNGLYRHIRTSKEIIRNLLNDYIKNSNNCCLLLQSRLRTRSCYFLLRQKVTKERPEGAEKLKSEDFSPLWTPPAAKIPWGKERLRAAKLVTSA